MSILSTYVYSLLSHFNHFYLSLRQWHCAIRVNNQCASQSANCVEVLIITYPNPHPDVFFLMVIIFRLMLVLLYI
jgi:hypothetical protein